MIFKENTRIVKVILYCKPISIQKGFRGNITGDGPRGKLSVKQKCLSRNGFFILRRRSSHFILIDVIPAVMQIKFGQNLPVLHSRVWEFNQQSIMLYSNTYVQSTLLDQDIYHIQYSTPEGGTVINLSALTSRQDSSLPRELWTENVVNPSINQNIRLNNGRNMLSALPNNLEIQNLTSENRLHQQDIVMDNNQGNYDFDRVFTAFNSFDDNSQFVRFKSANLSWNFNNPCSLTSLVWLHFIFCWRHNISS